MKALAVSPLSAALLELVVRLVRVLDSPDEARVLLPLITREIITLKVSRTIAERESGANIEMGHVAEAINYHAFDRKLFG